MHCDTFIAIVGPPLWPARLPSSWDTGYCPDTDYWQVKKPFCLVLWLAWHDHALNDHSYAGMKLEF